MKYYFDKRETTDIKTKFVTKKTMTLKEAILKALEDINAPATYMEVYNHIKQKGYFDFGAAETPALTVSSRLGDFIRNGDVRVNRIKKPDGTYAYYLKKIEQNINIDILSGERIDNSKKRNTKITKTPTFEERDLHKLLSTYLMSLGIYSKTIFHEKSKKQSNTIWINPDMVGIKFLKLQKPACENLLKSINLSESFQISSYEIKKEILSDSELKNAFFQAVSNSSWANYGYLVAFEFNDNLIEEMERLNQSFGIGIIILNANPYQSKILFPAKYRELDFKTIDKLCTINEGFYGFIELIQILLTATDETLYKTLEQNLVQTCDQCFKNDEEIINYCKQKNIPMEENMHKEEKNKTSNKKLPRIRK